MTDNDLLNSAIDKLLHNGVSSIDANYIRKYKDELLSDDIPEEERHLYSIMETDKNGIKYILLYSNTYQGYWNIRALWVRPDLRRQNLATALLSTIRKQSKNSKGVTIFVPFDEKRFALSKLLLKNGYKHRRYIASISATEYNSLW